MAARVDGEVVDERVHEGDAAAVPGPVCRAVVFELPDVGVVPTPGVPDDDVDFVGVDEHGELDQPGFRTTCRPRFPGEAVGVGGGVVERLAGGQHHVGRETGAHTTVVQAQGSARGPGPRSAATLAAEPTRAAAASSSHPELPAPQTPRADPRTRLPLTERVRRPGSGCLWARARGCRDHGRAALGVGTGRRTASRPGIVSGASVRCIGTAVIAASASISRRSQ